MNLIYQIRRGYGQGVVQSYRKWEESTKKLARHRNALVFSLRCKTERVTPNFLKLSSNLKTRNASKILQSTERKLVRENIRIETNRINKLKTQVEEAKASFLDAVGHDDEISTTAVVKVNKLGESTHAQSKRKLMAKVEKLVNKRDKNDPSKVDLSGKQLKIWVKNLSKYKLNKEQESVLAKGLNFAITPSKIPVEDFIVSTEEACASLDQGQGEALRFEVTKIISSSKPPPSNITKEERAALTELSKEESIQIIGADKGKCVVVMDKEEYQRKANIMLSDEKTYRKITRDPTQKTKRELIQKLTKLKNDDKITQTQYNYLYPTTEVTPRFYCTPKIHKEGNPLRPIVDYTGSVTYNVARALADLLNPLMGNTEHHLKNSKDLKDKLKNKVITSDRILISHDIVSLFTNVPIQEALNVIKTRLENDTTLKDRTNLDVHDIMDLLQFVCSKTYFVFNGELYEQCFGTAMGSPLSPILANLYMEHIEQLALETCPEECKPSMWYRYVDDILEDVPKDQVDNLTQHLNQVDPTNSIKFTVEVEKDNQIPMLDVLIKKKEDGHIETAIYRKKTHTDQYLNFRSHHPLHHKLGVVRTLLDRKDSIVTTEHDKEAEDKHICEALKNNGYPKWSVDLAKQQKTKQKNTQENTKQASNKPKDKRMVVLPYIGQVSEQIAKVMKSYGIASAMKPHCKIRNIVVHPKDKLSKEKQTGIIYQVPCGNCKQVYIGETGRSLEKRISEHKDDVDKNRKKQYTRAARKESMTEYNKSAITDHVNQLNHEPNWEHTKIVAREHYTKARKIKEVIAIMKTGDNMNRDRGNFTIPPVYHSIIKKSRETNQL